MALPRTAHVCQQCGYRAPKWLGRCPECEAWGSLVEETVGPASARTRAPALPATPWPDLPRAESDRTSTGIAEFDRVLGGGLVPGAVILLGGEPGIGKSTILLQVVSRLAEDGREVVYVSAEESATQLRLRGERLGVRSSKLRVLAETDVDAAIAASRDARARAVIVDSIQAVRCAELASVAGSVGQVREAASRFVTFAKAEGVPVVLVGHVTKDGTLAGPRTLEHVVDTILQFEGDRHHAHRILRAVKNRFGPADELGVFAMTDEGLRAVDNPSEVFLAERPDAAPGSTVLPAIEGSRALLVEVQALVGEPAQGNPRRTALGIDAGRLALILAVLGRRAGLDVAARDVFVNVPGGIEVAEPAADLAIALSAVSSLTRRAISRHRVVFGELGLTGEIRSVSRVEARLKEAARLGFTSAVVPYSAATAVVPAGLDLLPVRHLLEALDAVGGA